MTIRGKMQEVHCYQLHPTPVWLDSKSTVFVAHDHMAPKRSVWNSRRTLVMDDAVRAGEVDPRHLAGRYNNANYFTKYEVLNDYEMHSHYFLNKPGEPPHIGAGPNVADSFSPRLRLQQAIQGQTHSGVA